MTKSVYRKELSLYRKELRSQLTKAEVVMWKSIKGEQLGCKFRRQYSFGSYYIVDFFCPKLKLAVEIDGSTHNEEAVFKRDEQKEKYLITIGVTVKRYTNEQVLTDLKQVLFDLHHTCEELQARLPLPLAPSQAEGDTTRRPFQTEKDGD